MALVGFHPGLYGAPKLTSHRSRLGVGVDDDAAAPQLHHGGATSGAE